MISERIEALSYKATIQDNNLPILSSYLSKTIEELKKERTLAKRSLRYYKKKYPEYFI